jgi:hypothetical protein
MESTNFLLLNAAVTKNNTIPIAPKILAKSLKSKKAHIL